MSPVPDKGILDYRDLTKDRREDVDVCVIGSGAGGATVAKELAAAGRSVLILERGGNYDPALDFDQREDDMLAKIDGSRGLGASEDYSLNLTFGNCVGGATVHYWADTYRTPPDRLDHWARAYGVEGHSFEDLLPWFKKLETDLHVEPAPEHLRNRNNQLFKRGLEALGWHGHPVPQARKNCASSGYCMQGCTYNAKMSMLVTYVPAAIARGARVFADCEVTSVTVENGRAVGAEARVIDRATLKPTGEKIRVRSKAVVVAAGGYGSAVILMKSKIPNRSGQLGRNLHVNPCSFVHALFDEDVILWRNIPAAWGCDRFRLASRDATRYVEGGYLLMPNQLGPSSMAALLPGFGAEHRALMDQYRRIGGTIAWIDDEWPGEIRISADGTPLYRFTPRNDDVLKLRDSMKKGCLVMLAAGAKRCILPDGTVIRDEREVKRIDDLSLAPGRLSFPAPHPAGACRMGPNPDLSVVNAHNECHDVRNLFVCDPSVFPTAVSVDPSETIIAFSYVAAEWMKNNWDRIARA
jgi:choline dehydrogenase-like flavoprotein